MTARRREPRPAATVILRPRRRRAARGAARQAHARRALHGRRLGVPRRGGRSLRGPRPAGPPIRPPSASSERRPASRSTPMPSSSLRAVDHATGGEDPLRCLVLPRARAGAGGRAGRRVRDRRQRLAHRRSERSPRARTGTCSLSSRRSRQLQQLCRVRFGGRAARACPRHRGRTRRAPGPVGRTRARPRGSSCQANPASTSAGG